MLYSKTSGVMRFCTSTAKLPNAQGVNVREGSEEDETHRNIPEGQELARKKKEPKKGERGFIFKNKGTAATEKMHWNSFVRPRVSHSVAEQH